MAEAQTASPVSTQRADGRWPDLPEVPSLGEIGIKDWKPYVKQDPRYMRPAEVDLLQGDSSKAREKLGWKPEVEFPELIKMMVANDLKIEESKMGK